MLKIRGMDIYYIRGDDDSFTVQPVQEDGTAITGYTGVFSIKKTYDDTDYVLQLQMDGAVVDLTHDKTQASSICCRTSQYRRWRHWTKYDMVRNQ